MPRVAATSAPVDALGGGGVVDRGGGSGGMGDEKLESGFGITLIAAEGEQLVI